MSGGISGRPTGAPSPGRPTAGSWTVCLAVLALVAWSALVVSGHPVGVSLARAGGPATTPAAANAAAATANAHLVTFRPALPAATSTSSSTLARVKPQAPKPKPAPTTTAPTTTAPTTTAPKPPPTTAAPVVRAAAAPVIPPTTAAPARPSSYGCAAALQYLAAHSAPGFVFECPGYADGHQAMTCINVAGLCPNESLIAINIPCAAAYMNEAHNSWIEAGLAQGAIDPYGYCH